MKSLNLSLVSILAISAAAPAFACDLCGCYTPRLEVVRQQDHGFFAAVSEQFTHFGTVRVEGRDVGNPAGQYLDSSITQAVVGARFFEGRFGFQINVPLIYRSYERPEGHEIESGSVSGLGDVSLLASWVVFKKEVRDTERIDSLDGKTTTYAVAAVPNFSSSVNVFAGLKFPTGDASRLAEEFHENDAHSREQGHADAGGNAPANGIHGHDLALGTGSYDGVFGVQTYARYKTVFLQADAQYTLRGDGRYSYRYADDFIWSGGPGVEIVRRGEDSLALQCVLSGEVKGKDRFQGAVVEDSGLTSIYTGPRVLGTLGRVSGEVAVDLPVLTRTTALQATADYRIRAGFVIRF